MSDETLDFLKSWTAKHDADLIGLREEVKALSVEIATLGQQVGGLTTRSRGKEANDDGHE